MMQWDRGVLVRVAWAILRCGSALAVGLLMPTRAVAAPPADAAAREQFERVVRPLLIADCYACHSTASKPPMGGLRLDSRAALLKGGEHGPAIVPGQPDASLLLKAVRYGDHALQMPPSGKLSQAQIDALTAWIRQGAPFPTGAATGADAGHPHGMTLEAGRKYWAFLPLKRVAPPQVKTGKPTAQNPASWCRTPIDHFILDRLQRAGMRPNPSADRRTLIRRATFDLIGLPPTPAEVDAFVQDRSPDAYPKLIDRLLASPHYGERWGRHWLDLARFAESHGYEQDYDRPYAYTYRDFVVKALNADLPYDRFVRWQIAGDEIAPDSPLALMATGFLGAGTHATQITKNQVEKERYDELDDMASTTCLAFLGLTIGCARCHDHKYDPIPTRDYYRMISTFTTTVRSDYDVDLDPEGYRQAQAAFARDHTPLVAARDRYEREQLPQRLDEWLKAGQFGAVHPTWRILDLAEAKSAGGATFAPQPDGSTLATGKNPDFDTYTFTVRTRAVGITAIRLEALADPSMVKGGPGRAGNGNFALTDFRVTAAPLAAQRAGQQATAAPVRLVNPRATFQQPGLPVAAAIDDDPRSAWAVDPQFGKDHAAVFDTAAPIGFPGGTLLTFTLKFENNTGHNIGRPRLSITTEPRPAGLAGSALPERVAEILAALRADRADAGPQTGLHTAEGAATGQGRLVDLPVGRDGAQQAISAEDYSVLLRWYRGLDAGWQALDRRVQAHLGQEPQPSMQKAMICSEGVTAIRNNTQGGDFLAQTHFLRRGDPTQKIGVATQGFLQVLTNAPEGEKHWQVEPPKGWRTSYRRTALANWITDVDHGAGALLARVIVNRLWQHHFGRGIVATPSDFGVQGERPTHPELLDWLAGELIRNGWQLKLLHRLMMTSAAYMESGASDTARNQRDPEDRLCWRHPRQRLEAEAIRDSLLAVSGQLDPTMYGPGTLDEAQKRRSLYFFVKRSRLIPMMMLFDAPNTLQSIAVRATTIIAPQALLMMNNPNLRDYARALARRINVGNEGKNKSEGPVAVAQGYRLCFGREPDTQERADARAFLAQQTAVYLTAGRPDPDALALTDLCQVLLSLNEFIYID